jgi:hypothetical protein
MDLSNQILCRFKKCKQKVPPPSLFTSHVFGGNSIRPGTVVKRQKTLILSDFKLIFA